ncbi:MAG: hypothetical protein BRD35_00625 [Bacteroidetes bacterium QH_7_62_13]|nr:MAG: hypothetical protein BRD35_00625 [Bacteroidetes bacterium QH_7_62_13]
MRSVPGLTLKIQRSDLARGFIVQLPGLRIQRRGLRYGVNTPALLRASLHMPAPETILVTSASSGIGRVLSRRFTPRLLARKLSGWLNRRRRNVIFVCSSVSPL